MFNLFKKKKKDTNPRTNYDAFYRLPREERNRAYLIAIDGVVYKDRLSNNTYLNEMNLETYLDKKNIVIYNGVECKLSRLN